jgi:hypothetical protein
MKLTKLVIITALAVSTHFANATGSSSAPSDNQISNIECTQINPDHLRITCKMSNSDGNQSELNASLINYDVKNSAGNVISSGYGTTVYVDNAKLESQEEYSVVIYALVNGSVVSQSVTRHAPAK